MKKESLKINVLFLIGFFVATALPGQQKINIKQKIYIIARSVGSYAILNIHLIYQRHSGIGRWNKYSIVWFLTPNNG